MSMEMTVDLLELVKTFIINKANAAAESAGYNGRYDDGGASALRSRLAFYEAGFNRKIPKEWEPYVEDILNRQDPEYQNYLRLRNKFERAQR